jgi:hypothetical protein
MRVMLNRSTTRRARAVTPRERRRPHVETQAPPAPVAAAPVVEEQPLPASRDPRMRRDAGPQDRALYNCGCGVTFQATVVSAVRCPHCGTHQAW